MGETAVLFFGARQENRLEELARLVEGSSPSVPVSNALLHELDWRVRASPYAAGYGGEAEKLTQSLGGVEYCKVFDSLLRLCFHVTARRAA